MMFSSQQQKDAFHEKAEAVKRLLFPDGSHQRDTFGFLNAVFNRVLASSPLPTTGNATEAVPMTAAASGNSFLDTSGIYLCCKTKVLYFKAMLCYRDIHW